MKYYYLHCVTAVVENAFFFGIYEYESYKKQCLPMVADVQFELIICQTSSYSNYLTLNESYKGNACQSIIGKGGNLYSLQSSKNYTCINLPNAAKSS